MGVRKLIKFFCKLMNDLAYDLDNLPTAAITPNDIPYTAY